MNQYYGAAGAPRSSFDGTFDNDDDGDRNGRIGAKRAAAVLHRAAVLALHRDGWNDLDAAYRQAVQPLRARAVPRGVRAAIAAELSEDAGGARPMSGMKRW